MGDPHSFNMFSKEEFILIWKQDINEKFKESNYRQEIIFKIQDVLDKTPIDFDQEIMMNIDLIGMANQMSLMKCPCYSYKQRMDYIVEFLENHLMSFENIIKTEKRYSPGGVVDGMPLPKILVYTIIFKRFSPNAKSARSVVQ